MSKFLLLATLLLSFNAFSADTQFMQTKIERANKALDSAEKSITNERVALGDELRRLENQVLSLREKTAVARRKEDERTLSLSKLEERLAQWQEQQTYQQNLLDRYLQQKGVNFAALSEMDAGEKMREVGRTAAQMASPPVFTEQPLVLKNGEIVQARTLTMGPVTWFLHNDDVGLAERKHGRLNALGMIPADSREAITGLADAQQGSIVLDPTLGRATTRQETSETVVEHIVKGGIWVVPILIFAVIATVIALLKVIQLWRLPSIVPVSSSLALEKIISAGDAALKGMRGMQRKLLEIAQTTSSSKHRDDELFVQLQHNRHHLDKWINAVAVTAAVAPLLGLLGTVSGMIETFRMMTSFGSSDPEVISGGIAKALVTTELGLVVAIPALILNALLSRKARHYYTELENFALLLSGDEPQGQPAPDVASGPATQAAGTQAVNPTGSQS